jgi:hypothetical protein
MVTWIFIVLNLIDNYQNATFKHFTRIYCLCVILDLTWHLEFQLIDDILSRNCIPVIVGGTNYYIQVWDCFILYFISEGD